MQISFPNININNIKNVSLNARPAFKGIGNNLATDTFTKTTSNIQTVKLGNDTVTGLIVKDVTFDDRNGGKVPGFIIKDLKQDNQYFACVNGEAECRMVIDDDKENDCIYLAELYGKNNKGSVKGAGTELVKFAVEKSKEAGYKGRVLLKMGGSFPFHYKNNFRATRFTDSTEMNAALDYTTRIGCKFSQIFPDWKINRLVDLSEQGAEMLLNGERMIDKSKSQILYSTQITNENGKTKEFDMDFCDLGDKFAIQMINKNARILAQSVVMTGTIENGKLIPDEELKDESGYGELESVQNEFKNALKIAQEKYNE